MAGLRWGWGDINNIYLFNHLCDGLHSARVENQQGGGL